MSSAYFKSSNLLVTVQLIPCEFFVTFLMMSSSTILYSIRGRTQPYLTPVLTLIRLLMFSSCMTRHVAFWYKCWMRDIRLSGILRFLREFQKVSSLRVSKALRKSTKTKYRLDLRSIVLRLLRYMNNVIWILSTPQQSGNIHIYYKYKVNNMK